MKPFLKHHFLAALLGVAFTAELVAQPTAFIYQGHLNDSGGPAGGKLWLEKLEQFVNLLSHERSN